LFRKFFSKGGFYLSGENHNHIIPLSENVEVNIKKLEMALGKSDDLSIRRLNVSNKNVAIIHFEGIVDNQSINENVISPIIQLNKENHPFKSAKELADKMAQIFSVASIKFIFNWSELLDTILAGDTVILVDDSTKAITLGTKKIQSRSITEPTTQTVIKGPKDSFTENISTNISLVRSRIQNANLRLKLTKVGNVTKTDVGIMYLEGIANPSIVKEALSRLKKINIDSILEANYIEEAVRDNRKTLFPLMQSSERPDVVTANLLEGKVAIIIQGTPFVLILPVLLIQFFQSPEDYYENNAFSSFLRLIRIGSFLLNMYASAVYLALITHHQGLIPTTLMVT
jgi:spore germination protein KA